MYGVHPPNMSVAFPKRVRISTGGMLNLIRYKVLDGALVQVGGPENEELDLPFKDGSLV